MDQNKVKSKTVLIGPKMNFHCECTEFCFLTHVQNVLAMSKIVFDLENDGA